MSIEITFQPSGLVGLVAEGISIADAAHRMGVAIPGGCTRTENCTTCQVSIIAGSQLLSPATATEIELFGSGVLSQHQRLACQARIERSGELVVHVPSETKKADGSHDPAAMRKEFGDLPLDEKIKTLVQLEAITMYEALNAVIDKPLAFGQKLFDRVFRTAKPTSAQEP